jgi:hypothetical protein
MVKVKPVASVEHFDIHLEGTQFRVYKDEKPYSPESFPSVKSAKNWCKQNMKTDFKPFKVVTRVNDYNARSYIGEVTVSNIYFGSYNDIKIRTECKRPDGRQHSDIKDSFYFLFESNKKNLKICRRILEIWDKRNRLKEEENRLERELTNKLSKDDILRLGGLLTEE